MVDAPVQQAGGNAEQKAVTVPGGLPDGDPAEAEEGGAPHGGPTDVEADGVAPNREPGMMSGGKSNMRQTKAAHDASWAKVLVSWETAWENLQRKMEPRTSPWTATGKGEHVTTSSDNNRDGTSGGEFVDDDPHEEPAAHAVETYWELDGEYGNGAPREELAEAVKDGAPHEGPTDNVNSGNSDVESADKAVEVY